MNGESSSVDWPGRHHHIDRILEKPGPRTDPDQFSPGEPILCIGASGLGCEILSNLALSGFKDIHVIDMDTIDINVGRPKAIVAAEFVMQRVSGVRVTPRVLSDSYYMQFHIVICGLDSVEARRWMNATLVNMVDPDNHESLKPLIDGGTEGFKGQARVIFPTMTSCYECSLDMLNKPTAFPICTIANTPRLPEHYKKMDTDDPEHISWLYTVAVTRAKEFNIEGFTWSLTQGVVKNIIPAIAIIAASCCNEAFKLLPRERTDCPVCGQEAHDIEMGREWILKRLIETLVERQDFQIKKPSLSTSSPIPPTKPQLYWQAPAQLEEETRPNLEKRLVDLVQDGEK
ncbi:hypothetical protein K439DRAFT_1633038, partial [Ramaria rubella]